MEGEGDRKSGTCFVLTTPSPPGTEIRQHTDGLVDYVVRPAASDLGLRVVRMDALSEPGLVSDEVLRQLRNAELVIADLSFADATVMYALGVRHSFGMSVVHICTPSATFPFDIEGVDAVVIDLSDLVSVRRACKKLVAMIKEFDTNSTDISPVLATIQLDDLLQRSIDDGSTERAVVNGLKAIEQRLAMMERATDERRVTPPDAPTRSRRVFIIHGHAGELKHQLARLLSDLDFDVVILQEVVDSGRTIWEKLRNTHEDIGFAFVLLTPDDFGASHAEPDESNDRARQNVIFEYGLFSGLLEPSRVCAIQQGDIELPSDLAGLVIKRVPDGAGVEAIQLSLVKELKHAGYDVDANRLTV